MEKKIIELIEVWNQHPGGTMQVFSATDLLGCFFQVNSPFIDSQRRAALSQLSPFSSLEIKIKSDFG